VRPNYAGEPMAAPTTILWERDEHTAAKHRILRKYLDAWLPIMAKYNQKLLLIDGFAGPGTYLGGEDGSPRIMLKAFLEHEQRARIETRELVYFFIESHKGRADHLSGEIDRMRPLPANVTAFPIHGEYSQVMAAALADVTQLVPTFAFIDPFGYKDTKFVLTSRILGFPRCEVLVYFPTPHLARWVGHPDTGDAFTTLYGDRAWEAAVPLKGAERRQMLHDLFRDALARSTTHVRSFEIVTAENMGYHLFFGTGNTTGLLKMKEAMWAVDPTGGVRYRDSTIRDQLVIFEEEPDFTALRDMLQAHFGATPFSIDQAEEYTLLSTPFLPTHLRRRTLGVAEEAELLDVTRPAGAKKGTFISGTTMRFR
jgi:three-Cys-motif partner protein